MLRHLALLALPCVAAIAMASSLAPAQSPNGVKTLDPPGAVKAEGTWSLGARAGDFVFVAGMQGIDPATNILVPDPQARILRAFLNLKLIAQSEGASLQDCVRLTVYVSDLHRFAPMVDKAQEQLWQAALSAPNDGRGPAPVRRRYRGDRQRLLCPGEEMSQAIERLSARYTLGAPVSGKRALILANRLSRTAR
jgi:enamine deaminase RidA (YjgF/YER057c/UK114 family)